jgi:hypothetical protein
LDNRDIDHLA